MNKYRKYKPPLKWVLPGKLYRQIEPRLRDATMISYPKSGRTWHRAMLGYYMDADYDPFAPNREMRYFLHLAHKTFGQRHAYTHNGTELVNPVAINDPKFCDPIDWEGKRVLLLTREIKDLMVSCYYQARHRTGVTDLEISGFIRSETWGVDKLLEAFHRWDALKEKTLAFEHLTYEDLHNDPVDGLRRTVELYGTRAFDRQAAERAVEATRFDRMRKKETSAELTQQEAQDGEAEKGLKVRSGKVGSYTADLSPEDIRFLDEREAELGNPFRA